MDFEQFTRHYQARINAYLEQKLFVPADEANILQQAMYYAVQNGGKRFRPLLVYATGISFGAAPEHLDVIAAAIELIHAYSLIHDDLPAMDNSDLRRGKPTCHKVFGEAIAILAGDSLQSFAFELLATDENLVFDASQSLRMVAILANACGTHGMAGGQMMDLTLLQHPLNLDELQTIHLKKTGALLSACVEMALLACRQLTPNALLAMQEYAHWLGLAFQIRDDILDVEALTDTLGKPQGLDARAEKNTYPALLGLAKAHEYCKESAQKAIDSIGFLADNGQILTSMSHFVASRQY